jgi:HK97 family phage prohead protease
MAFKDNYTMKKREKRFTADACMELRDQGEGKSPIISGYAAVFNSPTTIPTFMGNSFREVIKPGAFDRALKEKQDVLALFNHNSDAIPLARSKSGTLKLSVDERGLKYEFEAPNTSQGQDLVESIRRRDIDGSSFAFTPRSQTWKKDDKGVATRELNDMDLHDVSPVTDPAYPSTSVKVRSLFPEGEPEDMPAEFRAVDAEKQKQIDQQWKESQELKLRLLEHS